MMKSRRVLSPRLTALTGMLSAVVLVFLCLASVIPTGWIGVVAVSGLVVAVAVASAGYLSGLLCYLVSGILSLLLVPSKQVSVLFLCLFGLYPLLKNKLERLKARGLEYVLKLAFFNLVLFLLYRLAYAVLFQGIGETLETAIPLLPLLMVVGSVVFLLYDYAFSKVMALLQARLVPQLRRRFSES